MSDEAALKSMQSYLDISPFQRWLGLKVEATDNGKLTLGIDWREEFVSNPHSKSMHGGILATLIDLGGLYAVLTTKSVATATVDLRVDYHRPASGGRLRSTSRIIKLGSKISTAETEIIGGDGKLVASGRGVYLMA
jgi:uncharacterized protein (TIGR00369 family)